ncbi:hypothetical protein [Bacillus wiedmannii]|uniref:hypothetical protein n=1 Tax=Bacillus wiedmannii TaxID=1890302 RepID=UPI00159BB326|nr:hypothetical protein [Bacillus wiedmannii]
MKNVEIKRFFKSEGGKLEITDFGKELTLRERLFMIYVRKAATKKFEEELNTILFKL